MGNANSADATAARDSSSDDESARSEDWQMMDEESENDDNSSELEPEGEKMRFASLSRGAQLAHYFGTPSGRRFGVLIVRGFVEDFVRIVVDEMKDADRGESRRTHRKRFPLRKRAKPMHARRSPRRPNMRRAHVILQRSNACDRH